MEYAAVSRLALRIYVSPVGGDDLFHQGQPQSGSLSTLFCGKKRVKYLLQHILAHAAAIVFNVDSHILIPGP